MSLGFGLLLVGAVVTVAGLSVSWSAFNATRREFAPEEPGLIRTAWNQILSAFKRGGTQHAVAGTVAATSGVGSLSVDVLPGPADTTLPLQDRVARLEDGLRNLATNTAADVWQQREELQRMSASVVEAHRQIDQLGKDMLEGDRRVATSSLRAQSLGTFLVLIGAVLTVAGLAVDAVERAGDAAAPEQSQSMSYGQMY